MDPIACLAKDTVSGPALAGPPCRICGGPMTWPFVDLGMVPLCQHYILPEAGGQGEMSYPLRAQVCPACYYVGLAESLAPEEIFTEYAYFSSTSTSWVEYIRTSVDAMVRELRLGPESRVVEMASNDGYCLQFFMAQGIHVLGVEPAANVAAVANARGVPTLARFFNLETAQTLAAEGRHADLLLAYNCLDHVPNLNDVVEGMRVLLAPGGVLQVEFPYLRALVDGGEFDTIYHDRCSYFSFQAIQALFARHGLRVIDVQRLPTHGGSLRVRACHADDHAHPTTGTVDALLAEEVAHGMQTPEYYAAFMRRVVAARHRILEFLIGLKREGHHVVGYGVPAKGNVLLNYCGIRADLVEYLVDLSPYKQGKLAPGTRLPIRAVDAIRDTQPSYVWILPWNIQDEVVRQMHDVRSWGGRFFVAIPEIRIL